MGGITSVKGGWREGVTSATITGWTDGRDYLSKGKLEGRGSSAAITGWIDGRDYLSKGRLEGRCYFSNHYRVNRWEELPQ